MSDIVIAKKSSSTSQRISMTQNQQSLTKKSDEHVIADALLKTSYAQSIASSSKQDGQQNGLLLPRDRQKINDPQVLVSSSIAPCIQGDEDLYRHMLALQHEHMPVVLSHKGRGGLTAQNCFGLTDYIMFQANGEEVLDCFDGIDCYIWHPVFQREPRKLHLPNPAYYSEYEHIAEALVNCNDKQLVKFDRCVAQVLLAAFLCTPLLGVENEALANDIIGRVPEEFRQEALDDALVACEKEPGALVASKLIQWGASPDATRNLDEMPALLFAVLRQDRPMISFLLGAGADPDLQGSLYPTPRSHLDDDDYAAVKDLFDEADARRAEVAAS